MSYKDDAIDQYPYLVYSAEKDATVKGSGNDAGSDNGNDSDNEQSPIAG